MRTDPAPPRPDAAAWQALRALPEWARELGFADAGFATLALDEDLAHLQRWLDEGLHGGMDWMRRDPALRAEPARLRPGTLSVISARMAYPIDAALAQQVLGDATRAYISRYALGRDYHRVLRARLLRLARRIEQAIGPFGYRVLADSAPALEKAMARNAGLGWIGKHTLLIQREAGSWFFLGEIYSDLPLPAQDASAAKNLCGSCSACLDICPTQAIIAPYRLDAARCISYLTIEHHGAIPEALRAAMGNRIFGCDDCQLVCPWNRYAQKSGEADFMARHRLDRAGLLELFAWDEAEWLRRTEGMALRRAGYARWLRNLAIALGNAPPSDAVRAALQARLHSDDEVLREHLLWALQRQGAA
ncbi:epoxyqueuosine reductase [Solimonas aquatica]|uniref:Epoxyqueuosine reductase n=1 Tax=Solimonas aquatica TaxID=489703 RepID=A0A1H9D0R1_9GAMM|nr:tRNA epoxyqueuosine(34) reductase QueG [Solimonas aquatica]SEQ07024.1 epoxyqueuosine reductase [Solimonas aquatica]